MNSEAGWARPTTATDKGDFFLLHVTLTSHVHRMLFMLVRSNGSRSRSAGSVRPLRPFGCCTVRTCGSIFSSISIISVWSWGRCFRLPADNSFPPCCELRSAPSQQNLFGMTRVRLEKQKFERPLPQNEGRGKQKQKKRVGRRAHASAHVYKLLHHAQTAWRVNVFTRVGD